MKPDIGDYWHETVSSRKGVIICTVGKKMRLPMSLKQNNFSDLFMNKLEIGCLKLNVGTNARKMPLCSDFRFQKRNSLNGQ